MFIERLKEIKDETKEKEFIDGLSQEDKIKLYDEIKNECDSKEKEFIATQAKIQQYQQEYNNELEKIKVLGLNSEEELNKEIEKIDKELTEKCLEYNRVIGG